MGSKTKKMKPSKGTNRFEDRFSDLPDHLIVHILSFMSTLDAVNTMLLRSFGNLWTLVPVLKFDLAEYETVFYPYDEYLTPFKVFLRFFHFVRKVLKLNRSPTIDCFDLVIAPLGFRFKDRKKIKDIQKWLRFAIDKQVKDLNFVYDGFGDLALLRCVATSQSLTTLKLCGCLLPDELCVDVDMKSLRKLSLCKVKGSNEAFNKFIAGCSYLQELIIDTVDELNILNVTSPTVSKLSLIIQSPKYRTFNLSCPNVLILDIDVPTGDNPFKVYAIDVSSLQVVNVNDCWYPTEALLRQFQNAEVFTLSRNACMNLRLGNEIGVLVTTWKRIVLWPYWYAEECLELIFTLMKSSAYLEELVIYNEFEYPCYECACSTPELSATSVMPQVKNVTIHNRGRFIDLQLQLQLVELLLGNAVVLEKLVIIFDRRRLSIVEEVDFVLQVLRFRKASANATVIFA